jgi:hypothetical protein
MIAVSKHWFVGLFRVLTSKIHVIVRNQEARIDLIYALVNHCLGKVCAPYPKCMSSSNVLKNRFHLNPD